MSKRPKPQPQPERKHWWETVPGVLTGVAAIITAVATLMALYVNRSQTQAVVTPPAQNVGSQAPDSAAQTGAPRTDTTSTAVTTTRRRSATIQPRTDTAPVTPPISDSGAQSSPTGTTEITPVMTTTPANQTTDIPVAAPFAIDKAQAFFKSIGSQKDASTELSVTLLSPSKEVIATAEVVNVRFPVRRTMPVKLNVKKRTPYVLESEPYLLRVQITTPKDEWVFSARVMLEWPNGSVSTHNFADVRVNENNPLVTLTEQTKTRKTE